MTVLSGIRVLEFEAIGPAPFGTMLLADMGAEVLRIDRPVAPKDLGPKVSGRRIDITGRGKRSVTLDLKHPQAVAVALELIKRADVLVEGFRPGTMERLGVGPDVALALNPRLVYARMTGWDKPARWRSAQDMISTTSHFPAFSPVSDQPPARRYRRSICSETMAVVACCLRSASLQHCSMSSAGELARSSMPR